MFIVNMLIYTLSNLWSAKIHLFFYSAKYLSGLFSLFFSKTTFKCLRNVDDVICFKVGMHGLVGNKPNKQKGIDGI